MTQGKAIIIKALIVFGIYSAIQALWQLLEIIEYGAIQPSYSDTIIGVILAFSIYKNLSIKIWTSRGGANNG